MGGCIAGGEPLATPRPATRRPACSILSPLPAHRPTSSAAPPSLSPSLPPSPPPSLLPPSHPPAVKYIDAAAIAAKGEADGAKIASMLGKKAAKSYAKGEADAAKFASKLAKGEADGPDCDKKADGKTASFTVTTTVTKEAKEGKVRGWGEKEREEREREREGRGSAWGPFLSLFFFLLLSFLFTGQEVQGRRIRQGRRQVWRDRRRQDGQGGRQGGRRRRGGRHQPGQH